MARGRIQSVLSRLELSKEPTTRDDSVGFEQLKIVGGTHFGRNDAAKILLYVKGVDDKDFSVVNFKSNIAFELLRLVALPMEPDANGHRGKGERGIGVATICREVEGRSEQDSVQRDEIARSNGGMFAFWKRNAEKRIWVVGAKRQLFRLCQADIYIHDEKN